CLEGFLDAQQRQFLPARIPTIPAWGTGEFRVRQCRRAAYPYRGGRWHGAPVGVAKRPFAGCTSAPDQSKGRDLRRRRAAGVDLLPGWVVPTLGRGAIQAPDGLSEGARLEFPSRCNPGPPARGAAR